MTRLRLRSGMSEEERLRRVLRNLMNAVERCPIRSSFYESYLKREMAAASRILDIGPAVGEGGSDACAEAVCSGSGLPSG